MSKVILKISMSKSKPYFIEKYGQAWFENFQRLSIKYLNNISPKVPNIGKSIFSMNYKFAPVYISWYKALQQLEIEPSEIDKEIWTLNENLMNGFPQFLSKKGGKIYFNTNKKKVKNHIIRQRQGKLHPYDWKIQYREIDSNTYEIDITECAYKKLAEKFQVKEMLPGVCRMDYLMANLMGNGFTRTKTLGDGDDCCNCRYEKVGQCEWSPEKGFENRK